MDDRGGSGQSVPGIFMRLLGPCALELNGTPVAIGGPRPQAVLLRLALAGGHLVTAERLIEDLWGDDPPASVVTTLQGYVSRLRSALGDPARLRREGPGYVLDLADDEVDCRRFEALVGQAESRRDRPDAAIVLLDEALGLWRGSALVDVADTEWGRPSAVRLEERRLEAIEARFEALLALGRHGSVVAEIELAVNDHPYRERFAAQLMTALYRCGRQADALRAYEKVRTRLLEEAGLDPGPELVALETAILSQDPALQGPVPTRSPEEPDPSASAASTAPETPRRRATDQIDASSAAEPAPTAEPVPGGADRRTGAVTSIEFPPLPPAAQRQSAQPFVGRDDDLRRVRQVWDQVTAGHRALLVVEGEAGAGKSRLAARVAAEVHDERSIVLWGRWAEESILPFGPVIESLRTVLLDASPEIRELVLGLPGLRPLRPFIETGPAVVQEAEGGLEDGNDRYRLFEGIAEMAHAESRNAPILWVLDDIQWADAPTLRLLQHLLQDQRDSRMLLLATRRTVPTAQNPALDAFLGEARRDRLLTRVTLGGFDHDEVAELLELAGGAAAPERIGDVLLATHGNPYFVSEIAEQGASGAVPDSVRDVISARLAPLGADAIRLLSAASVAGTAAPLDVLASASGLSGAALLDALDEAIAAGLLVEDAADTVLFRHGLVQQVVISRLSNLRRRGIHSAVADAYEAGGGRAIDVAHHLLEAGSLIGPDRSAAAALAAAREALSVYAYEATVDWTQRALAVDGVEDRSILCGALLCLSAAQRALADREGARRSADEATELARSTGDPLLLASAAEALMLARAGLGFDFGTADHELRSLLAEALNGLTGDPQRPVPELSPSDPLEGGPSGLRWLPEDALELAEAEGHHALVATAHLAVRMSIWRVDTLEQRLEADRLGLSAAERSNQPALLLNALLYLATDLTEAGAVAEASEKLERIRDVAATIHQPAYDAFVDFFDAQQALTRGEYARSAELADRALTVGGSSHGVNAELAWSGQVFIRSWDQGGMADMVELLNMASARAPRATIFEVAKNMSLVAAGRGDEVRPAVGDLIRRCWLDVNRDSVWLAIGGLFAEIVRALDEPDHAAVVVEHLAPYSGRIAVTGLGRASLGPVDRFLGVATSVTGQVEASVQYLRDAIELAHTSGAVAHEARARHDLARVLESTGDPGGAAEAKLLHDSAVALAGPIGLVLAPLGAPAAPISQA